MKIGTLNDIHLEFGEYLGPMGTGDVLLLAGDIHVAAYIHSDHPNVLKQDIKGRSERFYARAFENYDHVVEVAGNHEHYNGILQYSNRILQRHFPDSRLHILEKDAVQIKGVNFFGATFWTDFNRGDKPTMNKAEVYMNDYQSIQVHDPEDLMEYRGLRALDLLAEHQATVADLEECIKQSKESDTKLVVVSHHAPSKRSTHPRYRGDYLVNGAYSSDLERLMGDHIPLWVHGHTHDSFDYVVNGTRIVCNPRGYVGHHLNPHFNPRLEIEI